MIKNGNKVRACFEKAKTFESIVNQYGSFQHYIDSFAATDSDANLLQLKTDLQNRFLGLGSKTTYHFLMSIGMRVLKPDRVLIRIFKRLELLDSGADDDHLIDEAVQQGRGFAAATHHPIRYIDIVFVVYGQMEAKELGIKGICLERNPRCSICGAKGFCGYYRQHQH